MLSIFIKFQIIVIDCGIQNNIIRYLYSKMFILDYDFKIDLMDFFSGDPEMVDKLDIKPCVSIPSNIPYPILLRRRWFAENGTCRNYVRWQVKHLEMMINWLLINH